MKDLKDYTDDELRDELKRRTKERRKIERNIWILGITMGTNFYARIIPAIEKQEELIKAIQDNDFDKIKTLVSTMYGSIDIDYSTDKIIGGEVHLGKRSGGWKFLWNPNIYTRRKYKIEEMQLIIYGYEGKYLYPLTKEGIKSFIEREDVVIYDEYGEKQDKEEFY